MDNDQYPSAVEDSLFDKTRNQTSMSNKLMFGFDPYARYVRPPPSQQSRLLPTMSEMSVRSPLREDATMTSVCYSPPPMFA